MVVVLTPAMIGGRKASIETYRQCVIPIDKHNQMVRTSESIALFWLSTMQILLTEEEHTSLIERARHGDSMPSKEQLQELCTQVADNLPVVVPWNQDAAPQPWMCVLSVRGEHYCDHCPVENVCPNEWKHYSK